MAWLSLWAKRIEITVDHDDVSSALEGFPVLIYLSAASGIGDADVSCVFDELLSDANRRKIAVTTSDGLTQCPVEIEKWDDANEEAWLWVRVPNISDEADTVLYLYYDKSRDDNVAYVSDAKPYSVLGLGGIHPEGSVVVDGFLYIPNMGSDNLDKIDLSTFTKTATLSLTSEPETISTDGTYIYVGSTTSPAKVLKVSIATFTEVDSLTLEAGENFAVGMHIVGTDLYVGTNTSPGLVVKIDLGTFTRTGVLSLGASSSTPEEMDDDGTYVYVPVQDSDQLARFSIGTFILDAIFTLPANIEEPQELKVHDGYCYCATRAGSLNVGIVRVPTDDFQQSAVESIVFPSNQDRGCALKRLDGVFYVFSDNAGPKSITRVSIEPFARVDSVFLSGSAALGGPELIEIDGGHVYACDDTKLYKIALADWSPAGHGVWDNNFLIVDHMQDGSASYATQESTSHESHGYKVAAARPAQAAGKVSRGEDFELSTVDSIEFFNSILSIGTGDFTFECWMKAESWGGVQPATLLSNSNYNASWDGILLGQRTGYTSTLDLTVDGVMARGTQDLSAGVWYYVVGYRASGTAHLVIYGVEDVSEEATGDVDVARNLQVGKNPDVTYPRYFDGVIDEVRVSDVARSAAWIEASYESEMDDLLTFGAEEDIDEPLVSGSIIPVLMSHGIL